MSNQYDSNPYDDDQEERSPPPPPRFAPPPRAPPLKPRPSSSAVPNPPPLAPKPAPGAPPGMGYGTGHSDDEDGEVQLGKHKISERAKAGDVDRPEPPPVVGNLTFPMKGMFPPPRPFAATKL